MSLLEDMSVTLEEGSTLGFVRKDDGWEAVIVEASPGLARLLEPYIDAAHRIVDRRFELISRVLDISEETIAKQINDPIQQSIIDQMSKAKFVYPALSVVREDGGDDVTEVGQCVQLRIGDGGVERVLMSSKVKFAVKL